MAATARHHRDLFETPEEPTSIPISAEAQMLELLKALLTEALAIDNAEAGDLSKEADHDQDHA
jgi:hypothetical protein